MLLSSDAHICFISKRPDSSQASQIRWALPLEQRCICNKIIMAPENVYLTGTNVSCKFYALNTRWWYTDIPFSAILPHTWLSEYLSEYRRCNGISTKINVYNGFILFLSLFFKIFNDGTILTKG